MINNKAILDEIINASEVLIKFNHNSSHGMYIPLNKDLLIEEIEFNNTYYPSMNYDNYYTNVRNNTVIIDTTLKE